MKIYNVYLAAVWLPHLKEVLNSRSDFHHPSYNSLSSRKFFSAQENQDLPLFCSKSKQIESVLTPVKGEGLSCRAE